jgi:glycerol-3-phosphate dehydrogenase (NAD(P)+)
MNLTVLGAGAWGTALAKLLGEAGHTVTLWAHEAECAEEIRRDHRNSLFLPGVDLPLNVRSETDARQAVAGSELVVVAAPSGHLRAVTRCLEDFTGIVVTVTKGIEFDTGLTMSGVLEQTAPRAHHAALSGPTLALEVARGVPTAIVAASHHAETAAAVQALFHRPAFRVYRSTDLVGVELGGALKNVIAIAAGVCDGLGFGDNSKAALITRGLAEMRRLGVADGAQAETFSGLSGLGDLIVTCFSKLSRNRGFGERLGRGEKAANIQRGMINVAEGVPTARSAVQLARRLGVSTPIIGEVHALLCEDKSAPDALRDLMARTLKAED